MSRAGGAGALRTLFPATDRTFAEAGRVGLWTKADSLTHFDAFGAEELR